MPDYHWNTGWVGGEAVRRLIKRVGDPLIRPAYPGMIQRAKADNQAMQPVLGCMRLWWGKPIGAYMCTVKIIREYLFFFLLSWKVSLLRPCWKNSFVKGNSFLCQPFLLLCLWKFSLGNKNLYSFILVIYTFFSFLIGVNGLSPNLSYGNSFHFPWKFDVCPWKRLSNLFCVILKKNSGADQFGKKEMYLATVAMEKIKEWIWSRPGGFSYYQSALVGNICMPPFGLLFWAPKVEYKSMHYCTVWVKTQKETRLLQRNPYFEVLF